MQRTPRSHAFTLVEILIVVVILGILAAIVLPQFTDAATTTRATSNDALLHTLRKQLMLYRIEHHDQAPALAGLWGVLTDTTDVEGTVVAGGDFGPYLVREPVNAFTGSSTVVAPGAATADEGWVYDENTGEISAVGYNEATKVFTAP